MDKVDGEVFMKAILVFVCVASLTANSVANAATVFGMPDCGRWIKEQSPSQLTWLLGFLSGLNTLAAHDDYDPLAELQSAAQASAYIDNYCRANPLGSVLQGGGDLYNELQKRLLERQRERLERLKRQE